MNQIKKIIFFGTLFIIGLSIKSFCQTSANATVTVTMITPISIQKTTDMNFGNVAVSSTTSGTVVLPTSGPRTTTGGVTLPALTGTVSAAAFTVTGESGYSYSITLPLSPLTISSGAYSMQVNTFTSNPSSSLGGTLTGGTQTLNVGATLNVPAGQHSGTYTSTTPFTVTVIYN